MWPIALLLLWALLVLLLFLKAGRTAGVIGLIFMGIYAVVTVTLYMRSSPRLMNEMIAFATQYGQVQKKLLQEFGLPYALLDEEGSFLWMNDAFAELSGKSKRYHRKITDLFEEAEEENLPDSEESRTLEIERNGRIYRAEMKRVYVTELLSENGSFVGTDQEYLIAVCLFDETDLTRLTEEKEASQIVCGLLSLDNYDEAMEGVEDVRRSLLLALVERKINKYFGEVDCIIRKLSHDRFFFVMRKKSLLECEEQRFPILDDVKTVNIGNEMSLTLSIGIGCGEESYLANADIARNALELALGRGGDQVVVRDGFRTHFYGGNTESTEKITRVKARVKAQALQEIIESRSRVVVSIVADDISDNVRPVIESFRADQEYDADFFVTQERARELTGADTVLVVVDTNKPSYTACEELLGRTGSIVVLDHHRQGDDRITNAVLSYIEPYASSACEMVAEVLQYFGEDVKLRSIEADALYAGIVLDTSNFIARTGVRTFEAAAYLRRNGADVTRVRKMFRDDVEDCRAKAQAVADAEIFMDEFAVSVCPSEGLHSPTVVSAQAANELLNTRGIKATFVMTEYNGQVYISARAIDEVNVQLIMERLGGGGHLSVAGAQLSDYTLEEAKALLKSTIMEMKEEGDIA